MTNKEIYDIAKDCYINGNNAKLKNVLPDHYLCKDEKFSLRSGIKLHHGSIFDVARDTKELQQWSNNNYKLSGKYSDELSVVLLPSAPSVRIEIKNKRLFRALLTDTSNDCIDITHNVYFLKGIPLSLLVADSGCIHGAVISNLGDDELIKILTSPFPDERIIDCEFMALYIFFTPMICDTFDDVFTFLKNLGFRVPVTMNTTIPKWNRAIESAKLAAGSGTAGYKCNQVLTAYSSLKMVDVLSTNIQNRWGVLTHISTATLFEVVSVTWGTIVDNNVVVVVPIVTFRFGQNTIVNDINACPDITINKDKHLLHKRIVGFKLSDINKYCVGDMFTASLGDNGDLVLERRYGSGKVPILAPTCPKCNNSIDASGGRLVCVNVKCPSVVLGTINKWVDKFCVVDNGVLVDFLRRYEISNIADIYSVVDSGDMSIVEYLPIFDAVENSRKDSSAFLNILMPFLSIEECERIMISLPFGVVDFDRVSGHLFMGDTLNSAGVKGDNIDKILNFIECNKLQFRDILRKYLGCEGQSKLYGRVFVIVGLLRDMDSIRYEAVINENGGRVVSKIAQYITGCVYGEFADKASLDVIGGLAKHRDIAIYSEEEFIKQFMSTQKGGLHGQRRRI